MAQKIKLLLKEDITGLGITGDLVEVARGHARNYLLPQGKALEVNESTRQAIEKAGKLRAKQVAERKLELEDLAVRIKQAGLSIPARVSEAGTLYGSVAEAQIVAGLAEKGIAINEKMVRLEGHIKTVGDHNVLIHLHADIEAYVSVKVVQDDNAPMPEVEVEEDPDAGLTIDDTDAYGDGRDEEFDEKPTFRKKK